jgi:hypothetical protein
MCGPQTQLTTSLFLKTSLRVSAPTGHLQVITIVMTFNTCCFEDCSRIRIFETTRIECHYDSYHLKMACMGRNSI